MKISYGVSIMAINVININVSMKAEREKNSENI